MFHNALHWEPLFEIMWTPRDIEEFQWLTTAVTWIATTFIWRHWRQMNVAAFHITGNLTVCSTFCLGQHHRKHHNPSNWSFVREIHQWATGSPHNSPVTRKNSHVMMSHAVYYPHHQWVLFWFLNIFSYNSGVRNVRVINSLCWLPLPCYWLRHADAYIICVRALGQHWRR